MYCKKCGNNIPDDTVYCPTCGQNQVEIGQQKIKTHLSDAIIVALFFCLPLGIVAIVKAVKTSTLLKAGRYAEAEKASANAYKWVWISALVGLIGITVFIVLNMNS